MAALAVVTACSAGCNKDKQEDTFLSVDPVTLAFDRNGETKYIDVKTDAAHWSYDLQENPYQPWCRVVQERGRLKLTMPANEGISYSASLMIVTPSHSVKVKLTQPSARLVVAPQKLTFDKEGETLSVKVETDLSEWTFEVLGTLEAKAACRVVKTPAGLDVTMEKNEGPARKAVLVVEAGEFTERVPILQSGEQDADFFEVTPGELVFGPAGEKSETVSVETSLSSWTYAVTGPAAAACHVVRNENELDVTMDENTGAERQASLEVRAGTWTQTVAIVQQAGMPTVRFALPEFAADDPDETLVYRIASGGRTVGIVCNEYVPGLSDRTGKRVTVIYGVDARGVCFEQPGGYVVENGGRLSWKPLEYGKRLSELMTYEPGTGSPRPSYCIRNGRIVPDTDGAAEGVAVPEIARDAEGNGYPLMKIGRVIMARGSFASTRYRDGSPIPTGLDAGAWVSGTWDKAACCVYGYDDANDPAAAGNRDRYGVIYSLSVTSREHAEKLVPEGYGFLGGALWGEGGKVDDAEEVAIWYELMGRNEETKSAAVGMPPEWFASSGLLMQFGGYRDENGAYVHAGARGFWWQSMFLWKDFPLEPHSGNYWLSNGMMNQDEVNTGAYLRLVRKNQW